MAAGFWCAKFQPVPPSQHVLAGYADGLSRQVRGRVLRVRSLPPPQSPADRDKEKNWWEEKEASEEADPAGTLLVDLAVDQVEEVTPDVAWMAPVMGGVRMNVIDDPPLEHSGPMSERTTVSAALPTLHCGDLVQAPMRLKLSERYRDPGAWQYADYLLAQGIGAHASVRASKIRLFDKSEAVLPSTPADRTAQMQCMIFAAQSWASSRMLGLTRSPANRAMPAVLRLSKDDAAMLNAMLFGDRADLNKAQRVGFERTGSFHLFVVSGMHVALLAGLVFWAARRLRLNEYAATLLTLALAFAYALLTGFAAPVQRALFMTAIFLLARLLSRERNVMNALGAAALAVLAWSPGALFEASFQMTFLAIVAIGGIAIPLGERSFLPYARAAEHLGDKWLDSSLPPRIAQFRTMLRVWSEAFARVFGAWSHPLPSLLIRWSLWAMELALVGLVAELVMVLPMAVYFHRATMFAVPTNMLSVPLVALLAPMAVLTFCASLASSWLAMLPGALTALLLHGITGVIGRISAVHAADLRVPAPAGWITALAVLAWAFCCWAVRRSKAGAWCAAALLPLVALVVLWPERAETMPGSMEVTAIDVGQGIPSWLSLPKAAPCSSMQAAPSAASPRLPRPPAGSMWAKRSSLPISGRDDFAASMCLRSATPTATTWAACPR